MTKRRTWRLAGLLLALVLMTTTFTAGTFAKYTATQSSSTTARVAKFGITIATPEVGSLFGGLYAGTGAATVATTDGNTVVVKASNTEDKVIAPGTTGSVTTAAASGTSEVNVKLSNALSIAQSGFANDYFPITIKLDGQAITSTASTTAAKVTDINNQIQTKLAAAAKVYKAGTAVGNTTHTLSWEWAFSTTGNDDKDTALGTAGTATLTVAGSTTVEQTQEQPASN